MDFIEEFLVQLSCFLIIADSRTLEVAIKHAVKQYRKMFIKDIKRDVNEVENEVSKIV